MLLSDRALKRMRAVGLGGEWRAKAAYTSTGEPDQFSKDALGAALAQAVNSAAAISGLAEKFEDRLGVISADKRMSDFGRGTARAEAAVEYAAELAKIRAGAPATLAKQRDVARAKIAPRLAELPSDPADRLLLAVEFQHLINAGLPLRDPLLAERDFLLPAVESGDQRTIELLCYGASRRLGISQEAAAKYRGDRTQALADQGDVDAVTTLHVGAAVDEISMLAEDLQRTLDAIPPSPKVDDPGRRGFVLSDGRTLNVDGSVAAAE